MPNDWLAPLTDPTATLVIEPITNVAQGPGHFSPALVISNCHRPYFCPAERRLDDIMTD
jgi:hypothetical protein